MKQLRLVTILVLVGAWILNPSVLSTGLAKEAVPQAAFTASSPNDKLYALDITRFHFLSLKQFHSVLFSFNDYRGFFNETQVRLLNAGLNAFLNSTDRENLMLEALRSNKAVQLRFSIPEKGPGYEVLDHPTKPLLYRLEEEAKNVPVAVEILPLLDGPIAFQISVEKGKERLIYDVDWTGKIMGFSRKKAT